jgi:hypothetical protein
LNGRVPRPTRTPRYIRIIAGRSLLSLVAGPMQGCRTEDKDDCKVPRKRFWRRTGK